MESPYTITKPASHKTRKRVGTGHAAGGGKTCGRGMNGQKSRSGSKKRPWFEGGQMPLQRRVPKRGFNNYFKKEYQLVNVSSLEKMSDSEITVEMLAKKGLIDDVLAPVKILGNGELTKNIKVSADSFSQSAIEKIKKAGGEAVYRDLSEERKAATKTDKAEA
jgi:large subunit ribosomal protein L15